MMQSLIGHELKGYRIKERIGVGGFGAVYRAEQSGIQREVAIKAILPNIAQQPDFIRRFEAEAQLIARLEHMNIVPLYDYWRDPDGTYLVMRYLRGGSLKDALKQGAFDLGTANKIIQQIGAALDAAHRNGVIHRDLKPANILLDEDGNAYLADFGIAKDHTIPANIHNTNSGEFRGTLLYLAPEQARNEPITPRTDIYSLGVVLYEILAGEHPFPNLSPIETMYKHLNEPLPLLTNLDGSVLDAVNQVIQTATTKNPVERYEHIMGFAKAFAEAVNLEIQIDTDSIVEALTRREHEILQLLVKDSNMSNKDIAQVLVITVSTVKWYIHQLFKKLQVRNRVQLIIKARELNLIFDEDLPQSEQVYLDHTVVIPAEIDNPYKGLRAFQTADAQDFFGREKITTKILNRMQENVPFQRFLAIVGPSGSGKSSLAKAGVIPAIWRGQVPDSDKWFVVDFLPGDRPIDELEVALKKVAADKTSDIREQLERDANGLLRIASLILPDDGAELLVVIDQFEEVFTLLEDEAERQHFLDLLRAAVTSKRSRVRILVTLRADFFDRPLQYPQFGELMRERVETVLPLSAEELERAIVNPVKRYGLKFEEGLVSAIIGDINYQPGALPLLQYALSELFEQRDNHLLTRTAYQDVGGAVGALAKRADEIFHDFNPDQQTLAQQMFMRLVTLGEGTEDTRRRASRLELLDLTNYPDLMDEVIDTYANYRLLSLDHDPATREPTIEVAHEAILREWERLRTWLNDSRDDIKMQRKLAYGAQNWQEDNRVDGHLLSGRPLDDFTRWAEQTTLNLTPLEIDFLEASLTERHRKVELESERQAKEDNLQKRATRVLQGLVAVFVVSTVISGALALFAFGEQSTAQAERDNAQTQQEHAEREAQIAQSIALASESQQVLANGDHDLALILALEANSIDNPPIEAERALFAATYAPGTRLVMEGHAGPVSTVDISLDGRYGVSAGGKQWVIENQQDNRDIVYDPEDFSIRLWDLQTGQEIRQFNGHTDAVWDVKFSPDGTTILSASSDKSVILWDVETGEIIHRLEGNTNKVRSVAYLSDGKKAISTSSNFIALWNLETGEIERQIEREAGYEGARMETWDIDISADGQFALFAMRQNSGAKPANGVVVLLDLTTFEWTQKFLTPGPADTVAFSPNGKTALVGTHEDIEGTFGNNPGLPIVIHFDLENGQEISRFYHTGSFITGVDFSRDAKFAIVAGFAQSIYMWDLNTGKNVLRLVGHEDWIMDMALSSSGDQLITGSDDGTLRLWDLRNGTEELRINASPVVEHAFALSPDGELAAMPIRRKRVLLWNLKKAEVVRDFGLNEFAVNDLAFSPDGKQLVVLSNTKLSVYDTTTGQQIIETLLPYAIHGIDFTQDGRYLFAAAPTASTQGTRARFVLLDVSTGDIIRSYQGSDVWSNSGDISADGQIGYGTGFDGNVYMWNLASTEEIGQFGSPLGQRGSVKVDDSNSFLLTTSEHIEVLMWDIESETLIQELEGHSDFAVGLSMNASGTQAATASFANELIIWDLTNGQEYRQLAGLHHPVNKTQFMPDGQHVIGTTQGGDIIIWRISDTPEETIAWAYQNRYIREFTCLERERYNIAPLCVTVTDKPAITRTPYPTLTPSLVPSATPTNDPVQISPTPTWTAIPSYTPLPTSTPMPPIQIEIGIPLNDEIPTTQTTPDYFIFNGESGMIVEAMAGRITFQFDLEIYDPDGNLVIPDGNLFTLPVSGTYTVAILPSATLSGSYQLLVADKSE